jgi:hypothetical protein
MPDQRAELLTLRDVQRGRAAHVEVTMVTRVLPLMCLLDGALAVVFAAGELPLG